ncbi:MAG: pyridoxal phosphate-dependent aminotransferase [Bacteroidales bacterium]|nr:pyridoxal phosphate-dependent aminotransferase [Bacteroidales bacterium]HOY39779.1 pyridoxal phosphate-dependent aminotransferase [Bacteroidales bacterium]HQP03883.1 pyridoxal phosphate-dependent aminotransferase [Bacteroidales bacterium]
MQSRPNTSLISYFSNMVKQSGGINLAQGLPGFRPPLKLMQNLSEISLTDSHKYAPGLGLDLLRCQIAESCNSTAIGAENVMITNGGTEAISLIYTWLYKKLHHQLNVMSFAPVYESYRELPGIFGNHFYAFRNDPNQSINIPLLCEELARNEINLVFLATPGNPLGRIFSEYELTEICNYCSRKRIYLVIDLVYKYLYYDKKPSIPYSALSEYILFADSFSKQFSITGWRLGYLIAPPEIICEIASVHDYTGLSSPLPLQKALSMYLSNTSDALQYLQDTREKVSENFEYASHRLSEAGFRCIPAHGGIFLCTALPDHFDDGFQFASNLYKSCKVAVVPGEHFDREWKRIIRLNIAHPADVLNQALDEIIHFSAS